jgi:hypothetical protein
MKERNEPWSQLAWTCETLPESWIKGLGLSEEANKVRLKINESKTKYMIAAGSEIKIRNVGHSDDVSLEIPKRIQNTNRCYGC